MPSALNRDAWVRIVPFAVFIAVLVLRGAAPTDGAWGFDTRWLYGAGVLAVAALLALWWREYGELARQAWPSFADCLWAVLAGLGVFALWIALDEPWMTVGTPSAPFTPLRADGSLDIPLAATRWLGATLLVPVMEELFWRSFLMRWITAPVFLGVDPRRAGPKAVLLSTFVFTLAHTQWLAAAMAGVVYALLYMRSGRLWTAVIAHAVTNGALGIWVLATQQWQFW